MKNKEWFTNNGANELTHKGIFIREERIIETKMMGYYEKMAIRGSVVSVGNKTMILGAPGGRCTRCGGSGREPK